MNATKKRNFSKIQQGNFLLILSDLLRKEGLSLIGQSTLMPVPTAYREAVRTTIEKNLAKCSPEERLVYGAALDALMKVADRLTKMDLDGVGNFLTAMGGFAEHGALIVDDATAKLLEEAYAAEFVPPTEPNAQ